MQQDVKEFCMYVDAMPLTDLQLALKALGTHAIRERVRGLSAVVASLPQGQAQTALISLDQAIAGPCSPACQALIDRTCEDCE